MNDIYTRLRFYEMGKTGISISLSVDNQFTLIEGRYNEINKRQIKEEMEIAGCSTIDLLHISYWDDKRCNSVELKELLEELQPMEIEIPAYEPETEDALLCRKLINEYVSKNPFAEKFVVGPKSLDKPDSLGDIEYTDVIFSPFEKYTKKNDNSIIKIFKQGRFSFLNTSVSSVHDFTKELLTLVKLKNIDVLFVNEREGENPYLQMNFLETLKPFILVRYSDCLNTFVRKGFANTPTGLNLNKLPNGDVVVTSGIYKRKNDYTEDKVMDGSNGLYIGTAKPPVP